MNINLNGMRNCRIRINPNDTKEITENIQKKETKDIAENTSAKSMPRYLNVWALDQQWVSEDTIKIVASVFVYQDGYDYLLDTNTLNVTQMYLVSDKSKIVEPFKVEVRVEGLVCIAEAYFNMSEINEILLAGDISDMGRVAVDVVGDVYNSNDPTERSTIMDDYWYWIFGYNFEPFSIYAYQLECKGDRLFALVDLCGGASYDLENLVFTDMFSGDKLTTKKITDLKEEGIEDLGFYIYANQYDIYEIILPEDFNLGTNNFVKEFYTYAEFTVKNKITEGVSTITDTEYFYYFYVSDMINVEFDEGYKDHVWEPLSVFDNMPYGYAHNMTYYRGILYMLDAENHLHRYDLKRKSALPSGHIEPAPSVTDRYVMAACDDKLYLIDFVRQYIDIYDINTNSWSYKTFDYEDLGLDGYVERDLDGDIINTQAGVIYKDKVYVLIAFKEFVNDSGNYIFSNKMFVYDMKNDSWECFDTDDIASSYAPILIGDNIVYAIGNSMKEKDSSRVFIYNITKNTWQRGSKIPGYDHEFYNMALGATDNKLIMSPAYSYSLGLSESPLTYNFETKEFRCLPPHPADCCYDNTRSTIYDKEIYIIGSGNILYRLTHKDNLLNMEMDSETNPRYADEVKHDIDTPDSLDIPSLVEPEYEKTEWSNGDIITASKLNKIEVQLYEIAKAKNIPYSMTVWNDGIVITEELLNKIENKISLLCGGNF